MLTVALKANVLPLPENAWLADPTMEVRTPVTARPLLLVLASILTVTVNKVDLRGYTDERLAGPVPRALVAFPVRVKVPVRKKKVSFSLVAPLAELPHV